MLINFEQSLSPVFLAQLQRLFKYLPLPSMSGFTKGPGQRVMAQPLYPSFQVLRHAQPCGSRLSNVLGRLWGFLENSYLYPEWYVIIVKFCQAFFFFYYQQRGFFNGEECSEWGGGLLGSPVNPPVKPPGEMVMVFFCFF